MIPNDSKDFYPTPDDLARQLVASIGHKNPTGYHTNPLCGLDILEPSAGSGSILRAIEAAAGIARISDDDHNAEYKSKYISGRSPADKNISIDCIELSADFRAILKDKGFRVVHDDFLTFRPCKQYDAIVMNPPFSQGAAHLLKALEIQQRGGMIRCILNAETIRNPYTNERKALAALLEKYDAKVEYKQSAFTHAARRTNVEIAVVSVDIPKQKATSRIRLELKNELADRMRTHPERAALVSADPITAAIERYNAAAEGLRRLYDEFYGIQDLFTTAPDSHESAVVKLSCTYNAALQNLRRLYWTKLFDLPQISDNLTEGMRVEYSHRIEELSQYDFSAYNILTVRQEISANIVSGIEKELVDLFDRWTNLHYNAEYSKNIHYFNGWCTNEAYKVGKKVIFNCRSWDSIWNKFYFNYDVKRTLSNIEMTLHYLDASGQPYNGEQLRKTLDQAQDLQQTAGLKFQYFTATFYKKGTCHIEFTNEDVLKSFNLFACQKKGWLPPSYGKKSYRDMPATERKIVDNYEGETSYTDTLTRHLIPTQASLLQLHA